jgi:hypothetical protein
MIIIIYKKKNKVEEERNNMQIENKNDKMSDSFSKWKDKDAQIEIFFRKTKVDDRKEQTFLVFLYIERKNKQTRQK